MTMNKTTNCHFFASSNRIADAALAFAGVAIQIPVDCLREQTAIAHK